MQHDVTQAHESYQIKVTGQCFAHALQAHALLHSGVDGVMRSQCFGVSFFVGKERHDVYTVVFQ